MACRLKGVFGKLRYENLEGCISLYVVNTFPMLSNNRKIRSNIGIPVCVIRTAETVGSAFFRNAVEFQF